jgi:hypothetical protein
MAIARLALRQNGAVEEVARRTGGRPVALIVVSDILDIVEARRQHRLGALERLHLALRFDAQNQSLVGRIEVKPDGIAQLVDEEGVGRQLEAAGPMRLQTEQLENEMDCARDSCISAAIAPTVQCVPAAGLVASVLPTSSATASSSIVRGRPLRTSSYKPASRSAIKRLRHCSARAHTPTQCRRAARCLQTPRARHRRQMGPFVAIDPQFGLRPSRSHRASSHRMIPDKPPPLMCGIYGTPY